jgi:hypothetical protein
MTEPILELEKRISELLLHLQLSPSAKEEIELLRDICQGLADAEAGRVTPHTEVKARLLARYF